MSFLPLAERELRRMSRRAYTYYSRSVAGGLGLGVGLATLFAGVAGAISPGSAGHGLVCVLGIMGLVVAVFEGALMTADALSSERREGTLGLLFLTELRAHDIVLGKLVACMGRPFNTLLAMLPVPALGILIGGVELGEVFLVMAALMNTLFVAAAFGLWVSAGGRSERRVVFRALAVVIFWCVVPPVAGEAWHHWMGGVAVREAGWSVSPASGVLLVIGGAGTTTLWEWVALLAWPQVVGWVVLAAASWRLHHSWRDELRVDAMARPARGSWRDWWQTMVREPRRPVGDTPPLRWLAERRDSPRGYIAGLAMLLLAMFILAAMIEPKAMLEPVFLMFTGIMLDVAFAIKLDAMASRALRAEKQSGLLELLLLTPEGAERILDDTLLALKGQLLWPATFLLAANAGLMITGWFHFEQGWGGVFWVIGYGLLTVALLAGCYFSTWIHLHLGLVTGSKVIADRKALMIVIVVPALVTLALFGLVGISSGGTMFSAGFVASMLMCWAAMAVASLLGLYARAVCQLRDHLPSLAARTLEPPSDERFRLLKWLRHRFGRPAM